VSGATAESSPPEPLPRGRARAPGFGRNLARRVATALVALPALVALLLAGPPWLTVGVVAAALGVGLFEYFALMRARAVRPMRTVGVLVAGALFLDVVTPGWLGVPFLPLGALLLLTFTLSRGADLESVGAAATTLLGAVYLGALGGTIAGLRLIEPLAQGGLRLVLLLGILVAADSVAFFVGNAFGRRRLLPGVSPGKSVEGALSGLAGGVAGAFAVRALGLPELPAWHTAGLGLAVAAMGIVGDLDESLLKRWAGVKDSGTLFPGHGGMLDRLDSLLFGSPVLYYYFLLVR
jgi:phosphatidate cytidylyltransferase